VDATHANDNSETRQTPFERNGTNDSVSLAQARFPARNERMAFSVRETADLLGISEKSIRRLVARRLLQPSRALRHLLFSKKEVDRFLEETSMK